MLDERRLLIFCRRPEPGRVKTRLEPSLGAVGAANLYRLLLTDTLERLCRRPGYRVELLVTDVDDYQFRGAVKDFGVTLSEQQGDDLGDRMRRSLNAALSYGSAVVLIGSDCPLLDSDYVMRAFAALEQGTDVVLGPARDGGYVLLGTRRPVPELLVDMPWGTSRVLAETRRRVERSGLTLAELETLWDVDRPGDLERLWQLRPEWKRVEG